ncbi:MAG: CHAT domain-containing protein [Limnothrix sp. CACIAM 69d]|nr:MAG: CHAT domain-containing protein [Limnothrix sp. CACIAM 69d]
MRKTSRKKILILSANPKNSTPLRLDQEVREIDEGLTRAKQRDRFELLQKWAVRPRDVQRAILELTPQIVHFSGHGVGEAGLAMEDETGQAKLVSTQAIAGLFELFADQIECVLLNACYSEVQAKVIAQHIPYVIGMNQAVGDAAAREFAVGFYDALGAGRDIEFAYKFARNSIQMAGIPEDLTPVLLRKEQPVQPGPGSPINSEVQPEKPESDAIAPAPPPVKPSQKLISVDLEELGGQVPLDSPFYIERPPIEQRCYEAIVKPGALVRIKAPRQMGKSSLMLRILDHATQQGYRSVWLNLQAAGEKSLENPDSLLRWLCARVSRKLGLPDKVEEYWQGALGCNDKCTDYFELYLLEELQAPLTLGLDEVDQLFQYESVASDFFGLLRSWHEESKFNPAWRNLRLILSHSKEVYIPLNINQSPFNVGLPVELPPLNDDQVADLIQRHGLVLSPRESVNIMDLTGGHPYLLRVALYYLARGEITFAQLMQNAPTAEWAYGEHLRRHLCSLQEHLDLLAAMKRVITVDEPVRIDMTEAFRLASMGLVRFSGNDVTPSCKLYRQYFREMLGG